ncbi:MAG: protein kinase domain-containing protein, partial [Planctomycetota bacterium]
MTTWEPGSRIGALEVERELGRGAYGVVYLARDTLLGRRVALKVVAGGGQAAVPLGAREQLLTEARLVGNLNSPHIVTLYRLHPTDEGGWMQEMEFAPGGALDDRIRDGRPWPIEDATQVFLGLARALKTAHAARIIHGDIKPGNVLYGEDDQVKLADFGLARTVEEGGAGIDLDGQAFGTPRFMAPEVISGQSAGMAADVWSAGVLAYLLLAGDSPFPARAYNELFQKILHEDPKPLGPEIPLGLTGIVLRCLAKDAGARPSAAEVVEELERLAEIEASLGTAAAAPERPTNYVPPPTRFIGREEEIAQLCALLAEDDRRLVTVTGPGGIGKTRIALEICHRLLDRFDGGCWFVDLADAVDVDAVAVKVAEALGVPHSPDTDAAEFVAGLLEFRKPSLLVLDNFEQIVDDAAATVGLWLKRIPQATILVTSRVLLGLADEHVYDLQPLPTPDKGAADLEAFAGVQLFVERAGEAKPGFALDESNSDDVARICRELDGIPLALELAAARAKIMSPTQIARRLGQQFQLLKSTRRDVSPRQRTLDGAIEWSYELLADWEQEAFLQACYFRDGLSLEAAEEVIDLGAFADAPPTMDVAQGLREKSLFTAQDRGYETRLNMYRAIREYGQRLWAETAGEAN